MRCNHQFRHSKFLPISDRQRHHRSSRNQQTRTLPHRRPPICPQPAPNSPLNKARLFPTRTTSAPRRPLPIPITCLRICDRQREHSVNAPPNLRKSRCASPDGHHRLHGRLRDHQTPLTLSPPYSCVSFILRGSCVYWCSPISQSIRRDECAIRNIQFASSEGAARRTSLPGSA